MCHFPPASRLEAVGIYSRISCVDRSIIALTLKRKTIWMKVRHSLCNFVALNSTCFKPACGGKRSTFWKLHCLRKIALESKRPIHTWWTWCQITLKKYYIQYSKNQRYSINNVVEITDQNRCILFGPAQVYLRLVFNGLKLLTKSKLGEVSMHTHTHTYL